MPALKITLYIGLERLKDSQDEDSQFFKGLVSQREVKDLLATIFEDNGIHAVILFDPEPQHISITRNFPPNSTSLQGGAGRTG